MNTKRIITISISLLTLGAYAQKSGSDAVNASSNTGVTADTNSLPSLLSGYYEIKDALVAGNAETASAKASAFLKLLSNIDMKALSATDHAAFMSVRDNLKINASHIAEISNINQQREMFAKLSESMLTLAKSVKLSSEPVYNEYCPMKNATWLSKETVIKNPYYGNMMLSCGKVVETIQQ